MGEVSNTAMFDDEFEALVSEAELSFSRPDTSADASSSAAAAPLAIEIPPASVLRERFDKAKAVLNTLQGQRLSIAKLSEDLHGKVALAKARLDRSEEVAEVLQELQARAHGRSIGLFERLLSAILADVLPGEGAIKLDLDMRGNSPSLDVLLENGGNTCDVLEATGGAVTNVVCTGLRLAGLSRTKNRRFLVLDEPDCWLKPDRVPAFMHVLAEVAQKTRTQALFVSHYDAPTFSEGISVVRLWRDETGKVCAAPQHVAADWVDDQQEGLRAIELENFMAHEHTFIPCFPGATALVGSNNLGKSASMVSSLKAVAYGESSDKVLRWGGPGVARVTVHLERKRKVVWTRDPKRNPVTHWELWEGETKVREGKGPARNSAPDWVADALGIRTVDGQDLQLVSQKKPVFLLDQPGSARAQILSMGRESGHVLALMKRYDELKRSDRETVKTREPEVQKLLGQLNVLDGIDEPRSTLAEQEWPLKTVEAQARELAELEQRAKAIAVAEQQAAAFAAQSQALSNLPAAPVLLDTAGIARAVRTMEQAQARIEVLSQPLPQVAPPELFAVADLERLLTTWASADRHCSLGERLAEVTPPALPQLHDLRDLVALGQTWAAAAKALSAAQQEVESVQKELLGAQADYDELVASLGGQCPLCGAPHSLDKGHDHA